jgi:hypothetical protein
LWHRKSDRQDGVCVEECRDPDDHPEKHQPACDRQALQARNKLGISCGMRRRSGVYRESGAADDEH